MKDLFRRPLRHDVEHEQELWELYRSAAVRVVHPVKYNTFMLGSEVKHQRTEAGIRGSGIAARLTSHK